MFGVPSIVYETQEAWHTHVGARACFFNKELRTSGFGVSSVGTSESYSSSGIHLYDVASEVRERKGNRTGERVRNWLDVMDLEQEVS